MTDMTPNRRSVIRAAAWSVPAVAIAGSAPAFAASPDTSEPTYQTVVKTFTYLASGLVDITVEVTASNVPLVVPIGWSGTLRPIDTVSKVTIPAAAYQFLIGPQLGSPATIEGTSVSTSTLSGALGTQTTTTNLTIPATPPPSTDADLITVASGSSTGITMPGINSPGTVTITMGEPQSELIGLDADGAQSGTYASTLQKKSGNNYVLATWNIA